MLGCEPTCNGPRLPTTLTCLILLSDRAWMACSVMSVFLRWSRGARRMRATSSATFPCPTTTACSPLCRSGFRFWNWGSPLYHPTNALAENTPSRSSPASPADRQVQDRLPRPEHPPQHRPLPQRPRGRHREIQRRRERHHGGEPPARRHEIARLRIGCTDSCAISRL